MSQTAGTGTVEIAQGATLQFSAWTLNVGYPGWGGPLKEIIINGTYLPDGVFQTGATNITIGPKGYMKVYNGQWWDNALVPILKCNGVMEYAANGNQNVCPGSYRTVIFSSGGTKTLTNTTGIDSLHFVNGSVCASLNVNTAS